LIESVTGAIAIICLLLPVTYVLSPSTLSGNHSSSDTFLSSISDSNHCYTSLVNHLNLVTHKVKSIEQAVMSKNFVNPSSILKAYSKHNHYMPPVSFFINLSCTQLINRHSITDSVKFGFSFTNIREQTQYPIVNILRGKLSGQLMFSGVNAASYLHKHFPYFASRKVFINPRSDEAISFYSNSNLLSISIVTTDQNNSASPDQAEISSTTYSCKSNTLYERFFNEILLHTFFCY
ncbi:hypothetical protein, partial [Bacillus paranthracis]|uniref:hypothetical protein n=1 Tax=Bacillus paranthracis TaxID=2026186 RepID=UPI003D64FDF5